VCYLNGVSDAVRDLLYAAADLFVLPNRRVPGDMEGFGIVALEAATREVPVVAFGIEGITDAVIDGRNGYCIADGDYRAMREKILMLLRDPDGLRRFGRSAAAFTADRFAIDRITQKYSDLLIDLAQSQN
jgi:glycosyltransferase involved in cell wall biosynthesis